MLRFETHNEADVASAKIFAGRSARSDFSQRRLNCDRCFDGRMRVVIDQLEILELELVNVFDRRI
jgi:hypothetical protein